MKITLKEVNTGESVVFELGDLINNGDITGHDKHIYIGGVRYETPKLQVLVTSCETGHQEPFILSELIEHGSIIGSENHIYFRGRRFELRTAKTLTADKKPAGKMSKADSLAIARAAKADKKN